MTETETEGAQIAAEVLRGRGHKVVTCGDGTRRALSCAVLRGAECPLDVADVDVSVHVERPEPLGLDDQGVICAIRRHIPVVVAAGPRAAGSTELRTWAAAVSSLDELETTVKSVAASALAAHASVAAEAANRQAAGAGSQPCWRAEARRSGQGRIRLELITDEPSPPSKRLDASVRAVGALRKLDPRTPVLDVIVAAPNE